jgi:hypothetical protein
MSALGVHLLATVHVGVAFPASHTAATRTGVETVLGWNSQHTKGVEVVGTPINDIGRVVRARFERKHKLDRVSSRSRISSI